MDGFHTPVASPRGQGGDPTDAPGAYDSPVITVPLRNDNAVAPRMDREIARPPVLQVMDEYYDYEHSEASDRQTTLQRAMITFPVTALDLFHAHGFSRRATAEWITLADMVVGGLQAIPTTSERAVTFWLHHCSPAVFNAFRVRHPRFSLRNLPFEIYVSDGQGNLNIVRLPDATRRRLEYDPDTQIMPRVNTTSFIDARQLDMHGEIPLTPWDDIFHGRDCPVAALSH